MIVAVVGALETIDQIYRGLNQHRQHQERRQFSPGRRVRERSGSGHSSGHSSYSDHQHQEQQIAITVENEGGAPSNIPLKVYQKKVSIVYSINCIFLKTLKTRFLKNFDTIIFHCLMLFRYCRMMLKISHLTTRQTR